MYRGRSTCPRLDLPSSCNKRRIRKRYQRYDASLVRRGHAERHRRDVARELWHLLPQFAELLQRSGELAAHGCELLLRISEDRIDLRLRCLDSCRRTTHGFDGALVADDRELATRLLDLERRLAHPHRRPFGGAPGLRTELLRVRMLGP